MLQYPTLCFIEKSRWFPVRNVDSYRRLITAIYRSLFQLWRSEDRRRIP
jgi:hypothetical protein